jgi:hypothetical protein
MNASDVRERPILFSGPMVRAILDGRKTVTRRVVKPQPEHVFARVGIRNESLALGVMRPDETFGQVMIEGKHVRCPYGSSGDSLWVRETWCWTAQPHHKNPDGCEYRADETDAGVVLTEHRCWKPSIHMPRWASRISLEVVAVRVERVQEISEISVEDCFAEGISDQDGKIGWAPSTAVGHFSSLWDEINGGRPGCDWESNPWVWRIQFRKIDQ